jgi:hypothetical protein
VFLDYKNKARFPHNILLRKCSNIAKFLISRSQIYQKPTTEKVKSSYNPAFWRSITVTSYKLVSEGQI